MLQTNVLYVKIHAFYSQYAFSVSPLVFEIFNRQLMMAWNCHTIHTFSNVSYFKVDGRGT